MPAINEMIVDTDNTFRSCRLLSLYHTIHTQVLTTLTQKAFENIVGKGENAGNQNFLLFPECFLLITQQTAIFESYLFCPLQMLSIGPI